MSDNWAIETRGLGRRFGGKWAVRGLTLQVPKGAVYGFLGLNGAGKSTTIRMLMGMLTPDEGRAKVLAMDPVVRDIDVKRRVGYVPDMPVFYEWMRLAELLAYVASYRKGDWDSARADELVELFELDPSQKLKGLSKGQRTRVSLLIAMAYNPDILILDEPTGGLDPVMRRTILEDLLSQYMEEGRTIFISSHLINEISGLVDHVGVISEGKLIRSERVEDMMRRLRRVRLVFEGDPPKGISCTNMVSLKRRGREAVITVDDFDEAFTTNELARYSPAQIVAEELSLEDAFVELVSGGKEKS
jgi:ABC-2 type transport system ATP-binding protein